MSCEDRVGSTLSVPCLSRVGPEWRGLVWLGLSLVAAEERWPSLQSSEGVGDAGRFPSRWLANMAQGKPHKVSFPSHPVSPWGSRGVCGIVSRLPLSMEWWMGRACEQVVNL